MARMQGKITSEDFQYFAGVDVCKAHLDLRVFGETRGQRFPNDAAGIAALLALLETPHLVMFEPTGRYHIALWQALCAAGHGAVPYNPHWVRNLATGLGQLAKTDQIDAHVLCTIAEKIRPAPKTAPRDTELEIKELYAARHSAIKRRAMVRTQITANPGATVLALVTAEEAFLTTQITAMTAALTALIKVDETTRRRHKILLSIPGIGEGAAAAILTLLPEIGSATNAEIAALAGTAPFNNDSGPIKGRARTKGGRRTLRTALHMPAIVAMRYNPDLKAFADRLRKRGKHIYAVITATLRKLISLANTLVTENRLWTLEKP